jgi:hypothetical protein
LALAENVRRPNGKAARGQGQASGVAVGTVIAATAKNEDLHIPRCARKDHRRNGITRTADQAEDGGFVPKDWVLMRENPEGELEVVREGVADYDFDGDALIWSDGRRILRSENGKTTVLHRGVFIPRIVVCK